MNTYEALMVFKPILDLDNTDGVLKPIEALIQNLNGKILKTEKVGRKRLAYEVSKFKDGLIATLIIQMDAAGVKEFRKACQLNEDVLRLTLIRHDEEFNVATAPMVVSTASSNTPPFQSRGERFERGGDRPNFRGGGEGGERPERAPQDRPQQQQERPERN